VQIFMTDPILQEMGGRLWRNREASCNALSDLLQGRRWPDLKDKLSDIWSMTLRAVDDIKESVRGAAAILVKTLRNLTLRLCDPQVTPSKEAGEAVGLALPLMLEKGKTACSSLNLYCVCGLTLVITNALSDESALCALLCCW